MSEFVREVEESELEFWSPFLEEKRSVSPSEDDDDGEGDGEDELKSKS